MVEARSVNVKKRGVSRNPAAEDNRCSCSSSLVVASQAVCSHPGGREGSACSPLPFLWGTNLRVTCVVLVGLFGLGSVAWTEPRLLGTATGQQAWRSERAELEAGLLVAERCGLATTLLDSLLPSIEDPGLNPAAFSCFVLIYDDLRQAILAPGIVGIGTAVANSSRCAVPQQSPWPAGAFSCDCMFWGERGGGLTRQPEDLSVDNWGIWQGHPGERQQRNLASAVCG